MLLDVEKVLKELGYKKTPLSNPMAYCQKGKQKGGCLVKQLNANPHQAGAGVDT